jgi:GMP reductase
MLIIYLIQWILSSQGYNEAYYYDDVQLIPNKCIVRSRSDGNTSIKFGKFNFRIPVVPTNMPAIIDETLPSFRFK